MRHYNGERILPNDREVDFILSLLRSPKTISQLSAESGMHPLRVRPAIRILAMKHLIVEVDSDPETYLRVVA